MFRQGAMYNRFERKTKEEKKKERVVFIERLTRYVAHMQRRIWACNFRWLYRWWFRFYCGRSVHVLIYYTSSVVLFVVLLQILWCFTRSANEINKIFIQFETKFYSITQNHIYYKFSTINLNWTHLIIYDYSSYKLNTIKTFQMTYIEPLSPNKQIHLRYLTATSNSCITPDLYKTAIKLLSFFFSPTFHVFFSPYVACHPPP